MNSKLFLCRVLVRAKGRISNVTIIEISILLASKYSSYLVGTEHQQSSTILILCYHHHQSIYISNCFSSSAVIRKPTRTTATWYKEVHSPLDTYYMRSLSTGDSALEYKTGHRTVMVLSSGHSKIQKPEYISVKSFIESVIFTCVGLSERTNTCLISRLGVFFEKPRSAFSHARVLFDGYCWRWTLLI